MNAIRVPTVVDLSAVPTIERIMGPTTTINRQPLGTVGFSGSTHDRLEVRLRSGGRRHLVLKRVHLDRAWTAYRTGDALGREGALLAETRLQGIWKIFHCPYLAYALQDGEIGLLMDDLTESLLPDVDEPLPEAAEDRLLAALACLHAHHWNSDVTHLPWLALPRQLFAVLGPRAAEDEASRASPHPFFEIVGSGWRVVLATAPHSVVELLLRSPEMLARECADLPNTLIHGDAKVANFAFMPDGSVAAFDWAWMASAPCTLELGWYLAVNASRLSRPKEKVIARYRTLLETRLEGPLSDQVWDRLERVGIVTAALMLLWSKALSLESGSQEATREWEWWMQQLRRYT